MPTELLKKSAAEAALQYIQPDSIVGVGTGSTLNHFIDALATIKHKIEGTVASSIVTEQRLKQHGIRVLDLNAVTNVPIYIDGADEVNEHLYLIKGRGGAHAREKILACSSKKFICVVDHSKQVDVLGKKNPVPVEVIPMARGYVARELVKLGGQPVYRENFVTDNGNIILDVFNLTLTDPIKMEKTLKSITGVVESGIFAERHADVLLVSNDNGITTLLK